MDHKFQFLLLGVPMLVWQTQPFTLARRQARALLYCLADDLQPVPRERLIFLLWPDTPDATARRNLIRLLSYTRQALPHPDLLLLNRTAVALNPDLVWSDTVQFAQLCAADDSTGWEKSICLYRSRFLDGFTLPDSYEFDHWISQAQRQYERTYLDVLRKQVAAKADDGDYAAAIQYAQQYLATDDLAEEVHRQLISLYAANGDRSAALRQFEQCAMVLERELGVSPLPETRAAYEAARDCALGATPEVVPRQPRHNLPAQTTSFIGRETELGQMARFFDDPAIRLVTLLGPGGIGKTRLALEFAVSQLENFSHGVYFVSLAPLNAAENIVSTIAKAVDYPFQADHRAPKQQLLDHLSQKQMLLVLDNFEHLLDGMGLVNDILQAGPEVKVLATSRERLKLSGETVFSLQGMDFPEIEIAKDTGPAKRQASYSAVRLFLGRARQARPDFEMAADDLQPIARICHLVQGLPLGILLAAGWVEMLSLEEIVAEISQGLDFLETDLRDVPERQRSMRAVFDHSWQLLTGPERQVFQQLSVFRGGFTREAAQMVTGAGLRLLMALVNKSLLQCTLTGRYEVHELLRQYGEEKLDQSPDKGARVRDRHSAYYATFLRKQEADLKGPRSQAALTEIETELDNIQSAWQWAAEWRRIDRLDQASDGLGHFYEWRGRYEEGKRAFQVAAERLSNGLDGNGLRVLAKILTWQSIFDRQIQHAGRAGTLEDQQDGREQLQYALTLLDTSSQSGVDTRAERAFTLENLALLYRDVDRDEGRRRGKQSLKLYQEISDRWGTANVMALLGNIARDLGDYEQARRLQTESLTIRQAWQDQRGIAHSLASLSLIAMDLGEIEEAEAMAQEGVAICREMGDRVSVAHRLSSLGLTLIFNGKLPEAQAAQEESVTIFNELGDQSNLMTTSLWLGVTQSLMGHYQEALRVGQNCLTYFQKTGDAWTTGHAHMLLGWTFLPIEAFAEAERHLAESAAIFKALGQRDEHSQTLVYLGYAALKQGNASQARQYIGQALQTAVALKTFLPSLLILGATALMLANRGEIEKALELYALTMAYPLNTVWYDDVVGRHIKHFAATLSPEAVVAAQRRGKARDLWATTAELLVEGNYSAQKT